jgi:hypothetical protein
MGQGKQKYGKQVKGKRDPKMLPIRAFKHKSFYKSYLLAAASAFFCHFNISILNDLNEQLHYFNGHSESREANCPKFHQ